jgi:hypothetical protein
MLKIRVSDSGLARFRSCTIRGGTNEHIRPHSGFLAVSLTDPLRKRLRVSLLNQINCATAKTASRHSTTNVSRQTFRRIDHVIQFRAADFI